MLFDSTDRGMPVAREPERLWQAVIVPGTLPRLGCCMLRALPSSLDALA